MKKPASDTTAWKLIYLAKRNPSLKAEQFPQAWREHSALGRQCTNVQHRVRSVTQCVRVPVEKVPLLSTRYDGVNLIELLDRESADAIWSDPETLAVMRPDEPRVFDRYVRDFSLVAREHIIQPGPKGPSVLVAFLKSHHPADGMEKVTSFNDPLESIASTTRVVVNLVEPHRPPGYDFDVIVEWWFESLHRLNAALESAYLNEAILPFLEAGGYETQSAVLMATCVSHRRP
jgi:hypothetical protein